MEFVCDKKDCFGCHACFNICPKAAIEMKEDEIGALIPEINQEKCIDCGLCKKVCPTLNCSNFKKPQKTFAAIAKDENIYKSSTSGGVATLFSKKIIENGGVVYGSAVIGGVDIKHIRVERIEDLKKLQGSKYVQSRIGKIYKSIKRDLLRNLKVLFIGTPCQVDGLLMYLQKDYENLCTINIICHGTPPNRLLREHIRSNIVKSEDILDIKFRDQTSCRMQIMSNSKHIYNKKLKDDIYLIGFMRKLYYRNACYSCKYAQQNRVGDMTIGDFWGFDNSKPFPVKHDYGLSVILVNSTKGLKYFDFVSDELVYDERKLEEAVSGNPQLRHPSTKHRNTDKFVKLYSKKGFKQTALRCLWLDQLGYRMIFFLQKIRKK